MCVCQRRPRSRCVQERESFFARGVCGAFNPPNQSTKMSNSTRADFSKPSPRHPPRSNTHTHTFQVHCTPGFASFVARVGSVWLLWCLNDGRVVQNDAMAQCAVPVHSWAAAARLNASVHRAACGVCNNSHAQRSSVLCCRLCYSRSTPLQHHGQVNQIQDQGATALTLLLSLRTVVLAFVVGPA